MHPRDPAILMDDEPLLRTVSEAVPDQDFGVRIDGLISVMKNIARRHLARGLAAVQIGVPVRLLIVKEPSVSSNADFEYLAFINPTLDRTLNRCVVAREGCLSIPPRKWGDVSRPAKCDATWFDSQRQQRSATLTGEVARIFQHEFDHLNGILMTDHRLAA